MTKAWLSMALGAVAVGLLLFGILRMIDAARGQTSNPCVSQSDYERIGVLTLAAIDSAFKDQVGHLFTVWLKDPAPEPARATRGMGNAISAYQRARANAAAWQPVVCKG